MLRRSAFILIFLFIAPLVEAEAPSTIKWQSWSDDIFAQAARDKKLVLLDLEAIWCHWCHVMDQQTYSNPNVAELIKSNYLPVKVDQDSRPDLSNRYQDYGWPATIIISSKGEDLVKLSGFISPEEMTKILKDTAANPVPREIEEKINVAQGASGITADIQEKLLQKHYASSDEQLGGLKSRHKFIDRDSLEFALVRAGQGSAKDAELAKLTLKANRALFDPVWGGVYQYSTHGDWNHPHFEKIMSTQVTNLMIYSLAYSLWKDPEYLNAAKDVQRYLKNFLTSPEGAFYTSQDADLVKGQHSEEYFKLSDEERRKKGMPAIDKHIYARENGWAIRALATLYGVSGEEQYMSDAIKAAQWIIAHRALPGGGYRHDEVDQAGPYLADTLAMGNAFLSLYMATGDREWFSRAEEAARFISANFIDNANSAEPGVYTAKLKQSDVLKPIKKMEENIELTRFLNLFSHYSGKAEFKQLAQRAMAYVSIPSVALSYITNPGVLLADAELQRSPLHVTVVGNKDDAKAKDLFVSGLKYFSVYKRLEWWDKREGAMPNPDVEYPQLAQAAAFVCTERRCSLPIMQSQRLADTITMLSEKGRG